MVSRNRRGFRRSIAVASLALMVGMQVVSAGAAARRAQAPSKQSDTARLSELSQQIDLLVPQLKAAPRNRTLRATYDSLTSEYDAVSARLGGDRAAVNDPNATPRGNAGGIPATPPGCTAATQTFTNSTPVAISSSGTPVVTSTLAVSGAGPYMTDVNVTTFLTHTFNGDIDMTITSPAGTVVTLTTDNGSTFDNVFNGTVWDDDADPGSQVPYTSNGNEVSEHTYADLTVASPLTPEQALAAFVGENPNGTWTITISDDASGDGGSLDSWSLELTSLAAAPTTTPASFTNSTPVAISSSGTPVVTSTLAVSGAGTSLVDVNVTTFLTHTFNGDIDMTITSPAGTVVTLTTDNGSTFDNVFNGTVWDDDADPGSQVPYTANNNEVIEHTYADLTVASPLTPEEPLGAFTGEDPNGTWTITISDDASGDGGSLDSWTLDLLTASCSGGGPTCSITCPANVTATATSPTGAVVTYPAPTTTGTCGTVTCTPASGSTFPVGTTTVTCTASGAPTRPEGSATSTYSSGNVAVPIPTTGTTGPMAPQTIVVTDPGTITDLNLGLRINHTWDADLEITLTAPNGTTSVLVMDDTGTGGDNLGTGATDCSGTKTVLDDEASTPINSGTEPYAGSFIPLNSLSAFDGLPAAGTWTLSINDDASGDSGTLFCWELTMDRDITGGGGGSSTCSFTVAVSIPFSGCYVDDATGDTLSTTVGTAGINPGNPLYGYYEYHVVATGETFTGIANSVAYRPGISLQLRDTDDPNQYLNASVTFSSKTATAQFTDRTTGRTFTLRDRNITNNTCTTTPPPPPPSGKQ